MKIARKKRRHSLDLFTVGLALIPFDNLFFAPSAGWATIAPFFFLGYVVMNIRAAEGVLGRRNRIFIIGIAILAQVLLIAANGLHVSSFLDGVGTLALGGSFYLALILRYRVFRHDADGDAEILFRAYLVSFLYGLVWLRAQTRWTVLQSYIQMLEKRHYTRLSFTFTEPSFVSMHAIGVLMLYSCLVRRRHLAGRMILLGLCFLLVEVLTNGSARCMLDCGVFLGLYVIRCIFCEPARIGRNLLQMGAIAGAAWYAVRRVPRIRDVLTYGISVDASGASRMFRVTASLYGYLAEPVRTFFGWGVGNMILPLRAGYERAFEGYQNGYMVEVLALRDVAEIDTTYSFAIRLLSEWGILLTGCFIFWFLWRRGGKRLDPFLMLMTLWLYIQFDSYAFYTIWILIYLVGDTRSERSGQVYYTRISDWVHEIRGILMRGKLSCR